MDPDPQADIQKSPKNDTKTLRAILEIFVFFILLPTVMFGYPGAIYPSVVDWWDKGQAQLSVKSAEAAVTHFFGDDAVSKLFATGTLLIVKNTIPIWNGLVIHLLVRIVMALILSGAIYDLAKTAFSRIQGKRREG